MLKELRIWCTTCDGDGYVIERKTFFTQRKKCTDCNEKGQNHIKPDKVGIFKYTGNNCICPACTNNKFRWHHKIINGTFNEDSKTLLRKCEYCGFTWYEYCSQKEAIE